jgi:adenosine deaminase
MRDEVRVARRLIQAMPKAELHLHLDGGIRPATAIELALDGGIDAPRSFTAMFHALVAPEHNADQAALLRYFDLPIALLQDAASLGRVAAELVADKAADNVRYLEIKWAPSLHTRAGLSIDGVIDAVAAATAEAAARLGVVARLTVVGFRSSTAEENVAVAEAAVRHQRDGVSGFDLAGFEAEFPDLTPHLPAFAVARAGGLGVTVHAGELVGGADNVRRALALRPDRIAHGAAAYTDPDLVAEIAASGITLDVCPTSNVQAGLVPSVADHPLRELLLAGVDVTINTDDTTVSDVSLSEELLACHTELGLSLPDLWECTIHALDVAFVDERTRATLQDEFHAWAAHVPELHPTRRPASTR